jgi:hypothetical protein
MSTAQDMIARNMKSRFNQAPAGPPQPSRMTLGNVVKGPVAAPMRVVLYGPEGIGKSTFASNASNAIFLAAEDGTNELDVARLKPATWEELFEAIAMLGTEEHGYETLVIDTLDWAEQLCWKSVCARERKNSIEAFGYGRGYVIAHEEFRRLAAALDRLREQKGMAIVLLAHSWIKSFKNPAGDDFDRWELKLDKRSSAAIKEWADVVLFANYETLTHQDDRKRTRGVTTGARFIYTEHSAAFDAKNRHSLPPQLPLYWEDFVQAVAAGQPATLANLHAQIAELLTHADPQLAELVAQTVAKAGDNAAQLAKIASRLEARIHLQQTQETKQ